MSIQQFVTALMEAWNSHDLEQIASFYAPDYEGHDVAEAGPHHGPEGVIARVGRIQRALPDVHYTLDQIIVQDDTAVLVWTARGTHQGRMVNIPATGRSVQARGVSILTISDGRIQRAQYIWDVAGILRGIGLLPEL